MSNVRPHNTPMTFSRLWWWLLGLSLVVGASGLGGSDEQLQLDTPTGRLHGTLDVPPGPVPRSVVLLISGSGPTDRDGNQPQMNNDSLRRLGRALAARGIAVLRYDKRGVGQSLRAARREEDLRFDDFVTDAVAWIDKLRRDHRFDKVGVIGHSEGSLIGILVARRTPIDAFVSIAGISGPAPLAIREQLGRSSGLTPKLRARADEILTKLVSGQTVPVVPNDLAPLFRPSVQPYLISWFRYDPATELPAVKVPTLLVQGTTDVQVPVDHARRLAVAGPKAQLVVIDGMNHVLKKAATPEEQKGAYTDPSVPIDGRVVDAIAVFLRRAFQT